jgi:modulator of FtsH protease
MELSTPSSSLLERPSAGAYLARVYAWLTAAVTLCAGTAYLAVSQGATSAATFKGHTIAVTPAVQFVLAHPWLIALGYLGVAFLAMVFRKQRGIGPLLFLLFPVLAGLLLGPSILWAEVKAGLGGTLSAHPVRDAGLLTVGAFTGLSAYAIGSRKDFSRWSGFLFTGLLVLIGVLILNLFLGSPLLGLLAAAAGVLLFLGFILYDTSTILHGDRDDALGDAMNLFLDVLNLFSDLLHILGANLGELGSSDD